MAQSYGEPVATSPNWVPEHFGRNQRRREELTAVTKQCLPIAAQNFVPLFAWLACEASNCTSAARLA
jgi:hypothetical protein